MASLGKTKKYEVNHTILSMELDGLNKTVAEWVTAGWKILEIKIIQADYINRVFTVFYIIQRDLQDE